MLAILSQNSIYIAGRKTYKRHIFNLDKKDLSHNLWTMSENITFLFLVDKAKMFLRCSICVLNEKCLNKVVG
jgi:hypothetical protein